MAKVLLGVTWGWRVLVALAFVASVLGLWPDGIGMRWLVDAEVWLANTVPDPILTAFLFGLLLSSWVVPFAWKLLKTRLFHVETARTKLAHLRSEGVAIRNEAIDDNAPLDGAEWDAWRERVEDWTQRAVEAVKPLSLADAEWFKTLDTFPPPRIEMATPLSLDTREDEARNHLFAMLDCRLARLEELIKHFRGTA